MADCNNCMTLGANMTCHASHKITLCSIRECTYFSSCRNSIFKSLVANCNRFRGSTGVWQWLRILLEKVGKLNIHEVRGQVKHLRGQGGRWHIYEVTKQVAYLRGRKAGGIFTRALRLRKMVEATGAFPTFANFARLPEIGTRPSVPIVIDTANQTSSPTFINRSMHYYYRYTH
jgi:hypothetical protein